jgi:glycosyltransferase involved in cell wall biosynthesis
VGHTSTVQRCAGEAERVLWEEGYVEAHSGNAMACSAMKVDVLHVVPAFFPTRGGIEVLVENLAQALNESSTLVHGVLAPRVEEERSFDFQIGGTRVWSVDTPHPDMIRLHHEGIDRIPREHAEIARVLRQTRSIVERTSPKIIHMHGLSLVGSAASAVAEGREIPVVMHVHGSVEGALSTRMRRQLETAAVVVTVSEYVSESVKRETGRIRDVRVVRNGLPDPLNAIDHLGISASHHGVSIVGRLEVAKGFDHALRELALLRDDFGDLTVSIIGVGMERESLELLAQESGLGTKVRFLGRLERNEVLREIRRSACVVVPSVAYEGFSLVALEAAFLQRPVVASNVGGLPETVLDSVTGTIVDPTKPGMIANAVSCYLSDPQISAFHGRNARERALRDFSMTRMAAEIQAIHSQVLA